MSLHKDKRVPFDISERWRAEDALRRLAERQAMLLEVTSDLIRASEPAELGRKTFEYVRSAFGAVVCTNYRLDPATRRLRLVFVHGIPPKYLEAAQSLELGQGYCGTAAASSQPLVADTRRITSDPNGGLVRELGATAYACYPLKASDGCLLGTFAVASATRDCFTDGEVTWLGTITNFLAQPGSGSRRSRVYARARRVCSLPWMQPSSAGGSTIRTTVCSWETRALKRFSMLPLTRRRSRKSRSGCIR